MISNKYSKANNKYLPNYDPTKPSTYAMYLDANNLYGWSMSQHLPTGNIEWLTRDQIDALDITGYVYS